MIFLNKNTNIVHLSDIHIRFGSRHTEYKTVLNRTVKDVASLKPRRIVLTGDMFHLKINLSPAAIEIAARFISALSKIAPVDILLGNHDLNEQDLSQGNAIKPLIDLISNGYILTKENTKLEIPSAGNGIYFYHDSGFYNIDQDLIYGVYSLWDQEILTLTEKDPSKLYIALYHGPVYGCIGDNGYEMKSDNYARITTFNNFDIVMLGDIHEYQTFERNGKESAAFAGSLIQQNFGESIEKGYLVWNLETCEHERKFIPNDYGFSKINISKGEIWEERLETLKFSFDKKKTKVYVEIEDDRENESVELKSHIKKFIKSRWGCESIEVEFIKIARQNVTGQMQYNETDLKNPTVWKKIVHDWLTENGKENIDDVLEVSDEVEKELNLTSDHTQYAEFDLEEMITYNLFSHPAKETKFNFNELTGIVGIFGENYSGKSNIIKALIWILFGQLLGGGNPHSVVNLYTGIKKAYGYIYISISGIKFRIFREVTVTVKKDGKTAASYDINYEYLDLDTNKWESVESERAAKEKPEAKKMIVDAVGTFENFTKISLQTQGGKDDYLSLSQQPKNDLIREYCGATVCDIRQEHVNKKFNQIKNLQKNLGDPNVIEENIEAAKKIIIEEQSLIEICNSEKEENTKQLDVHENEIFELAKKIIPTEELKIKDINLIKAEIEKNTNSYQSLSASVILLENWLEKEENFFKEIPKELESLDKTKLLSSIASERNDFTSNKEAYVKLDTWLKENPIKTILEIGEYEKIIEEHKLLLITNKNQLKLAKGEKCDYCGHESHKPDLQKQQEYTNAINLSDIEIKKAQDFIAEQKNNEKINNQIIQSQLKLESLKNILQSCKLKIDQYKFQIEQLDKIDSDITHNALVKSKKNELLQLTEQKESTIKKLDEFIHHSEMYTKNIDQIKANELINNQVSTLKESIKSYKLMNFQSDEKIKSSSNRISVQQNNIENFQEKLKQIKDSVRIFNKYSIYLQAVSRDGIPLEIIKKKLPTINNKIDSVLRSIVNFKLELTIDNKGDIKESFFFTENKSDALPLSSGSGSQKFICSVAIREALHYISCLVKPSFCIIDEGFGTLDKNKLQDIGNVFNYLKNKYKSVIVITHLDDVKDCVDKIIQVRKTSDGVEPKFLEENPEAGLSQITFS